MHKLLLFIGLTLTLFACDAVDELEFIICPWEEVLG